MRLSKTVIWIAGLMQSKMLYQKPLKRPCIPWEAITALACAMEPPPPPSMACTFVASTSRGIVETVVTIPAT